jgi:hypothetical protein
VELEGFSQVCVGILLEARRGGGIFSGGSGPGIFNGNREQQAGRVAMNESKIGRKC